MGIFSSLSSGSGSSAGYYKSAGDHFSKSGEYSYAAAKNCVQALSNIFSFNTAAPMAVAAWEFEGIAGKIISTNAATHMTNLFTGGEFTALQTVTKVAASALVSNPVTCLGALMATSAIASNPQGAKDAVLGACGTVYNVGAAAGEMLCAGANAGFGLACEMAEIGAQVESIAMSLCGLDSSYLPSLCGSHFD
jgi:hypothetical protein